MTDARVETLTRVLTPMAWGIALAGCIRVWGVPWSREVVFLWACVFLVAARPHDFSKVSRGVVVDWLPFFALLTLYDVLRGMADDVVHRVAFDLPIHVDRWLFAGTVPSVGLQRWLHDGTVRPHDRVLALVQLAHAVVPIAVAGALWLRDRQAFRFFRTTFLVLTYLALLTFWLVPTAPPWMASQGGHLAPTSRIVADVWNQTQLSPGSELLPLGHINDNPVAALPSLHNAYPLLVLLMFWNRRRLRWLLIAYTFAMAATSVYFAEHYVFDILVGWAYAGGVFAAAAVVRERAQVVRTRVAVAGAALAN